ncbi:GNAT family N-acetyltransferase [soil metagenome]
MNNAVSLNDITITNELGAGDLGYIIHMHGRLYKKECDYGPLFEAYVASGLLEFHGKYDPKTNRIWICKRGGKMIGCLVLMNRGESAQLRYFIIEPEYRSIGLGRKLMDLYMESLKEFGYRSVYLLTTDGLPASAHLYKSYGFVLTSETKSDAFGKIVMEQRYDLKF